MGRGRTGTLTQARDVVEAHGVHVLHDLCLDRLDELRVHVLRGGVGGGWWGGSGTHSPSSPRTRLQHRGQLVGRELLQEAAAAAGDGRAPARLLLLGLGLLLLLGLAP